MAIISTYPRDRSDLLCGRFAALALSYVDQEEKARDPAARVPIENLYRVLEMCKHEAFADESRRGVLALQQRGDATADTTESKRWHLRIESAIRQAVSEVFGNQSQASALDEVEAVLRWLATSASRPSDTALQRSRDFFGKLATHLA
jgi:hypothetical protein